MTLPDATYFIASSRLRPGLDGGFTIATMQRAADLAATGADVTLLTFDPPPIDGVVEAFVQLGLASPATRYRNLFDELRHWPALVRTAPLDTVDDLGTNAREQHPRDTLVSDAAGAPLLLLPFVEGVDWFRSSAPILVFDAHGEVLGALPGFGALYRLWVDVVVAESRDSGRPAVVLVEARSLGELLGPHPRDYALVHTVHSAHTSAPYAWDSPMDSLWSGWFELVGSFDAVLWPTRAQRAAAIRRVGEAAGPASRWFVVPHPARPLSGSTEIERDPSLTIIASGLRPIKRVDHAVRAWPMVLERVPDARLEILGDGPEREALEALIASLGLGDAVTVRGHVPNAAVELERASLALLTSTYEGQSLAILEALAAGVPVVSYDVPYGPGEMIADSGGGVLVPSGDVGALAEAIAGMLTDPGALAARSGAARSWAAEHGVAASMAATGAAVRAALST